MKKNLHQKMKLLVSILLNILLLAAISSCTKSRKAELPEEQQASVFAISEFGEVSENSKFEAEITSAQAETLSASTTTNSAQAIDLDSKVTLSAQEVNVPERLKFMFDKLPLSTSSLNQARKFKITFSVDKEYVTAYKVTKNLAELSVLEKAIALSTQEVRLISKIKNSTAAQIQTLEAQRRAAVIEKDQIKISQKEGALLVPLFKYKIESFGVLVRSKNELKEETAKLEVKKTEWKDATHIELSAQTDSRLVIGSGVEQIKELKQVYLESKIDNQIMTSEELQKRFSVGMNFISDDTKVYTRLDPQYLNVYEITDISKLTENQLRLLKNNASNQHVLSCQDKSVAAYLIKSAKSSDKNCVIVLSASIPVSYKNAKLAETNELGSTDQKIQLDDIQKINSVGLVEIKENVAAKQVEVSTSGKLDPNSTIRISDIKGEFFYRRTFESASNMFLGRTGTSGDMTIIRFELEDTRIVVRNQQSLISYTGQGPKDREEMMSFPVEYFRMSSTDEHGNKLTIAAPIKATKENAEYAQIDWTKNTVPDANSPLAFYAGGDCFYANSSLVVTDTDMRLATDGILNYSLSGSYTVKPTLDCVAAKDVNSAYWAGAYQFNFNVTERISFMKHKNPQDDVQIAKNISSMAQAAFNFGVFTLADKVTDTDALANRDGSEKYMPMIHDFRKGKKLKYHLGGINNAAVTSPERRQLLIEATKQVIDEWNRTLKLSFKGTNLERTGDYLELIIDEQNSTGHLGDLDRNYIWLQELPAENNLLGVAQPAANPRSGTIQAANVIVYTGNTYEQTETLLKVTKIARDYEKEIEKIKEAVIAKAALQGKTVSNAVETKQEAQDKASAEAIQSGAVDAATSLAVKAEIAKSDIKLKQIIKVLQLDNAKIKKALTGLKNSNNKNNSARVSSTLKNVLTKDLFKGAAKGREIKYPVDSQTFLKKLTELASQSRASKNPNSFELEVNKAFIQFGNLDENVKQILKKRSQLLDAAVRFDENMKNRPGCFSYARNDINDKALNHDPDPKKNLMFNFKKNVMSTLSHELGHAFGLLHNFTASTDKANYEFTGEAVTGRNYSSIMDYIADIDMNYQGPGPYDAHAIRAAYTGMVESAHADQSVDNSTNKLVSIDQIVKDLNIPLVHVTRDTVNPKGKIKHYKQCDDSDTVSSVLCARFDSGGSATEIMQNLISDYHRAYVNRNYVHDKILFAWSQKIQIISRNITLFQNIRAFLDEAIMSLIQGTGLPEDQDRSLTIDQLKAAKLGYNFFHELIRTPDAEGLSVMDAGGTANSERFMAAPYKYKNAKNEEVRDIKIIEARSIYDISLNNTREKIDTVGISYDKVFALLFLLQSTSAQIENDDNSQISYIDLEQFFLGVAEPAESPTMRLILEILQNDITPGFFAPTLNIQTAPQLTQAEFGTEVEQLAAELIEIDSTVIKAIKANKQLSDQTVLAATIGLAQAQWRDYDAFAATFKVSKSNVSQAPKDRPNVAKMKQDKSLDDTKVLFASQNAVGADVLVSRAARTEFFILNKDTQFAEPMLKIYKADIPYLKMINQLIVKACEKGKEDPACIAAKAKKDHEHISENPDIAAEKAKADEVAQAFVAKLRELNTSGVISGIIIDPDFDVEGSPINLDQQVETLRELLRTQLNIIMQVKRLLEATPAAKLSETIDNIVQQLNQFREKNAELESLPLLVTAFAVIADAAESIPIKLQNGGNLNGKVIAGVMMNTTKLEKDLNSQLPVLEKLAEFTGLVDPDTVGR